jgi:hypothetical protein
MNEQQTMTPAALGEYLEMLRQKRQAQAVALAQMLPPQGMAAMAPFALPQQAQQPISLPQVSAPPITESREVGPAPGMAAPRVLPLPQQGAMQGPLLDEMKVRGFDTGAGSYGYAQEYADKFAGGDLSKVKSRVVLIDGQPINDFYTKSMGQGLLEALPSGGAAQAASGGKMPGGLVQGVMDDPKKFGGILGFLGLNSLFGG